MQGYLIEYNRKTAVARVTEFTGPDGARRALQRRLELEAERSDPDWEIVALTSDSIDTVRATHSRYFQGQVTTAV